MRQRLSLNCAGLIKIMQGQVYWTQMFSGLAMTVAGFEPLNFFFTKKLFLAIILSHVKVGDCLCLSYS